LKLKKNVFLVLALVVMLALAGCGNQGDKAAAPAADKTAAEMKPVTLKFADFFPPTHPASVQMMQAWGKKVEEATNGLVKVDYYPAGTLLKNGGIYEGVASGVADVGHDVSGYNAGRLPVLNAMYLGGVEYKNAKVSGAVARDLVKELQPKELQDTQLMFIYGIAPGVLMTTKPVRTVEDLKGLQIRASGTNVDTLKLLGATPVGITIAETYDSMSKGVVDGALLPAETLKGFKLGDVTKYVTETSLLYNTVHYCTMNKDVWNSFPKDIQDKINKVNEEISSVSGDLFDKINEEGLKFAVEEKGVEVIKLSDAENAKWQEKLKPLNAGYIKVMNEKGVNGQEVMDKIIELTEKYNKEFAK
jgi:TRAP-type C4-dicarboxylate transport system substrate-binding protein